MDTNENYRLDLHDRPYQYVLYASQFAVLKKSRGCGSSFILSGVTPFSREPE
jgi:hypothetical protein